MVGPFKVKYLLGVSKVYNGKTYCDVTVMQIDDVKKMSCDEQTFAILKGHEMEDVIIHVDLKEFTTDKGIQRNWKIVGAEVQSNGK